MIAAQVAGAIAGTVLANVMFDLDVVTWSTRERSGGGLWLAEVVATTGLLLVVFALIRTRRNTHLPYVVGAYIGGAYYFTSSTSFANPAVTIGRMFSDTFAGIKPADAPTFILMQFLGVAATVFLIRVLFPPEN
tara:strand:+ start:26 stop:427 length:402 start_codon:yes stop_codon:yes gene_type:complete